MFILSKKDLCLIQSALSELEGAQERHQTEWVKREEIERLREKLKFYPITVERETV